MGSLYDDDDEEFDLAAVEARHEELEALEALDTREGQLVLDIPGCQNITDEKNPDGIYPESDWEAIVEAVLFTMGNSVELRQLAAAIDQSENVARRVVNKPSKTVSEGKQRDADYRTGECLSDVYQSRIL